jgi:cell volume regulation protein A
MSPIPIEMALLAAAILLLASIFASKVSDRLGIPSLLIFLGIGMLAGSDGIGGIYFDDPFIAQSLGVIALCYILFAGGLSTGWTDVRPVLRQGCILATLGVLVTAALAGWFASVVGGFPPLVGFLLGSIISSTDAAAVFSVLRSRNVSLRGNLKPLLELESGSNDPMAVLLTIACISLLQHPGETVAGLIPMMLVQLVFGAGLGYLLGRGMIVLINRIRLEYDGLYPVLSLAMVLLIYGLSTTFQANGFLAVYAAGIVMGNHGFIHKRSLMRFHDGLAWLMQISMFLVLGLLVFPSRLPAIAGTGLLVTAFLMLVARPAAVFLTLVGSGLSFREQVMVAWVGLRGAVPIILATFPLLAGIKQADMIFNIVFFVVLASALLQGTSIPQVARWLGVDAPISRVPVYPIECESTGQAACNLVDMEISDASAAAGKQLVELSLPEGALVVLINRGDEFIIPTGGTILNPGDRLLFLAAAEPLERARTIIEAPRVD